MISPTDKRRDSLQSWRETVFNSVIRGVAFAGIIAYILGLAFAYENLTAQFFFSYTAAFLWVMITAFLTRIPAVIRAYNFSIILFVLGILSSIEKAAIGDGRIWLFLSIVATVIFLGRRAGWVFTIVSVIAWGVIGYFFTSSTLPIPVVEQFSFSIWSGTTLTLLIAGVITVLSVGALLNNLGTTIQESLALAEKSEEQSAELEKQRKNLEDRSATLEASVNISRRLAALSTAQDIFREAPELLQEGYSLQCAAVFVLEKNNLLRLESSLGWKDQALLKDEYVLSIDEGITGLAVREARAYSDNSSSETLRTILPETRSFSAIPLRGRNKVTGVIVLQSTELDFFDAEKVTTLQALADQMAVLIENAILLREKESALEAERRAYGEVTQAAWGNFLQSQDYRGYQRDKKGLSVISENEVLSLSEGAEKENVPISIRGKVVGYISAQKPDNRAWTVSEKELLGTLAARLENALDSARLYEESQRRATRERLVSQASTRMRERLNIDAVLQAAAQELHKAIGGAAKTEVWIAPQDDSEGKSNNGSEGLDS